MLIRSGQWQRPTVIVGAGSIGCDKPAEDVSLFQADLSGANEFPTPRGTGAVGTVGLYVDGNTVNYTIGGTLRNPEPAFQLRLNRKKTVAAGTA
jgi:hypothetical protein